MAGIGQSSVPSSDQTSAWSSQYNMGRTGAVENHANLQNKYFQVSDKRRFLPTEENGIVHPFNRQQTGFQSTNIISNDKSYLSMQPSLTNTMPSGGGGGGNSVINYSMYHQRTVGDSGLYQSGNIDISSQSKHGFNSSSRIGTMPHYLENSISSHSYFPPTPHRTISGSSSNINVQSLLNGQNVSSKSRTGIYNFDSQSSIMGQWDGAIGNFDSSDFPSLKSKPSSSQITQLTSSNFSYLSNKNSQINYHQMVMKSGHPTGHSSEHATEFSIQQEDFPALPVAQNPVASSSTTVESQRSSSAAGLIITTSDNSSACHSGSSGLRSFAHTLSSRVSVTDSHDSQKYPNYCDSQSHEQSSHLVTTSSVPSTNNSSQQNKHIQKKITLHQNNYITNIPNEMVSDAFGLIALVKLIGVNDTHENMNLLAPGLDSLTLNRELNSTKDIYPSFVSPISSNSAGRPQDMDYPVPKEYRIRHLIFDKLADPLPDKLSDETLFWIFYNLAGEECQLIAAKHLMARQWRYNRRERFWLTRDPKAATEPITYPNYERGTYIVWDYEKVQRVTKTLTVYYKDLEPMTFLNSKSNFPFCYNSLFLKRNTAVPPHLGPARSNKNIAAFMQHQQQQPPSQLSHPSAPDTRLLNLSQQQQQQSPQQTQPQQQQLQPPQSTDPPLSNQLIRGQVNNNVSSVVSSQLSVTQ